MSELCGNPAAETGEALMPKRRKFDRSRVCVKCKTNPGNLVIRHSVYCKDCFTPLISTKFRQALEPHINHVSTGFSGGLGSSVLLDLVHKVYCTSVGGDESKGGREHPRRNRVWKKIHVCYVEMCDAFPETSERIAQIRGAVTRYEDYEFISVRIQDAFDRGWWERVSGGVALDLAESLLPFNLGVGGDSGPISALRSHLRALPTPTAIQSTLSNLTRLLLLYTAYSIGASHLVLGTSLTSLSISLISSISQGGGFVVPQAIHEEWMPPFVQRMPDDNSWNGEVRLVRPLRDIGIKECTAWVWWHQFPVVGKQRIPIPKQTIGNLTKDFIIGLERDYPSTVSTIAKTVGKLAPKGKSEIRCIMCELPTQRSVQAWKAQTAIHSFTEGSPADLTSALPSYLCYSCHTTLTSKSSRSTAPRPSDMTSAMNLPTWAAARLALETPDKQSADLPSCSRPVNEICEIKRTKLDVDDMKSVVDAFLLDK
ncbi:hypothetical protein BGW80DRAFT_1312474 [Lactifluus volemus]|nr:hypothetical protein BGW80DRAFT_1312474 [Lactifluus volemus]